MLGSPGCLDPPTSPVPSKAAGARRRANADAGLIYLLFIQHVFVIDENELLTPISE